MSRDLPGSESGPGATAPKKQFVSVKDYGALNPLPCLATIFRKSGSKSRSGGGGGRRDSADCEDVLLHSVSTLTSAVAEEVRFTAQGKRVVVGQLKFLIPSEYNGWFEVLSQDGRATRPIEAVRELSALTAPSFVVRQSVSAYRQQAVGDRSPWAAEVVREGALLRAQELVESLPQRTPSDPAGQVDVVKGPFLRCLDESGGVVCLSMEARGLFSPVACRSSIVGAHDIRSLLAKFRLPVLVRLIHHHGHGGGDSGTEGSVPRQQQQQFSGASSSGGAQRIFRLVGKYSEDIAFALLLNNSIKTTDGREEGDVDNMLALPANDKYLISKTETKNSNRVNDTHQAPADDDEMKGLRRRCEALISNFRNSIRPSVAHRRHWLMSDKAFDLELIERNQLNSPDFGGGGAPKPLSLEEQQLFREIEELYADVRNPRHLAVAPPKPRPGRQRQHRDQAETNTKFPKSFKMASFSNGALVGNTFLFSRNPVFQGNVEKSNRKHTGAVKDDLDQPVPAVAAGVRHGRKDGVDDGQVGTVRHPGPMGVRSAATSRENLYEEAVALKPLNATGGREPLQPLTRGRLQKPTLEISDAPKNAEAEQQKRNTKIQRAFSHHNPPVDRQVKGQRSAGNRMTTAAAVDNSNQNEQQPLHSVDRIDAAVRDPGLLLVPLQRESNARTSYRIDQQQTAGVGARPDLLRPKSYAGTPNAEHQQQMNASFGRPSISTPTQSPPKRVKSVAEVNVLSELPNRTELTVSPFNRLRQDQRLQLSKSTTALNSSSSPLPPAAAFGSNNFPTANRAAVDAVRRTGSRSAPEENRPLPSKYANPELKTSKEIHSTAAALLKPERRLRIRSANDQDAFPSYV